MKKLLAAATLVAIGAGTVGVGAMDDVQLRGSDTLKDITIDLLAICPGADPAGAAGLVYLGTGSGNGESGLRDTGIPGTVHTGVNVTGGCSDGADADTLLECQTVAPMSRFLQATATCAFPEQPTTGPKSAKSAALAEGISFALDGIVIVGAPTHTTTCNDDPGLAGTDPEDCDSTTGASAGFAYARTITVTDENTTPGIQCAKCTGGSGDQYTLGQGSAANGWKDVLRIIYTGATMDVSNAATTIADRDCDGDLRHTIVNHWGDMFQNDCTGGSCTQLKHAFRRDDESGTTDTFLTLIGAPAAAVATGVSPFCNAAQTGDDWSGTEGAVAHSLDTESNACCVAGPSCAAPVNCAATGLTCLPSGFCGGTNEFPGGGIPARASFGTHVAGYMNPPYNADFQDNDPIRRLCTGTYDNNTTGTDPAVAPAEQVCRARRPRNAAHTGFEASGTLGLVLPINPPPLPVLAQAYPTKPCKFGSFSSLGPAPTTTVAPVDPEYPAATRALIKVDRCPNGDIPQFLTPSGGRCLVPLAADGDPACISGRNNLPVLTVDSPGAAGSPVDTTDRLDPVKTTFNGGASGLWAGDGRVYNLHLYFLDSTDGKIKYRTIKRASVDVPVQSAFYRIHTTRTLTGTGAGSCQENSATKQIGCLVQASPCSIGYAGGEAKDTLPIGTAVAFKVNTLEPTKACIRKLINPGTGTAYPISRQLYFNTMAGFENVTGQELELTKCYAGAPTGGLTALETIITDRSFITRGDVGDPKRNPACVDFQQQGATAAQGCNQPLVSAITCTGDAECPLGYTCNGTVCVAPNDACANNPAGIPNDDPAVP
jgi:hypothetical protein